MKILFAVSNENISDAIVKSYQKNYNEAVTYKNVFYFNAIIKEIQRDRTYDRIIISEDLEPFANNNYDAIDKFIFERLDSIAMEINDFSDKRIPIILICTDRRTKSSNMIKKIYNSGIFDAVIGSDRKIDNVCKLINTPRSKEEAAQYYKLDEGTNENKTIEDVSEEEVQNIVSYYKKLGKNEERFTDSFNNIAAQYTDEQLKIIIRYLPINVKAVLETECAKYQELVTYSSPKDAEREKREKQKIREQKQREQEEQEEQLRIQIEQKKKEEERRKQEEQKASYAQSNNNNQNVPQIDQVSQSTNQVQNNETYVPNKIVQQAPNPQQKQKNNNLNSLGIDLIDRKINNPGIQGEVLIPNAINTRKSTQVFSDEEMNRESSRTIKPEQIPVTPRNVDNNSNQSQNQNKNNANGVNQNVQNNIQREDITPKENTNINVEQPVQKIETQNSIDDEFEDIVTTSNENVANNSSTNATLPGFEDLDDFSSSSSSNSIPQNQAKVEVEQVQNTVPVEVESVENSTPQVETVPTDTSVAEPVKRGRGRPRKTPIDAVPKPKGKRGRPRKNPLPEDTGTLEEELESTDVEVSRPIPAAVENNSTTLPGFENESMSEDFSSFDTFEVPNDKKQVEVEEQKKETVNTLPGFEDDDEFENIETPKNDAKNSTGLDDDFMNFNIKSSPEPENNNEPQNQPQPQSTTLPGMDFENIEEINSIENETPNTENVETNNATLPGLDDFENNNPNQEMPKVENTNIQTQSQAQTQTQSTTLPGFEEDGNEFENLNNNISNAALNNASTIPEINDFDSVEEIQVPQNNIQSQAPNPIENTATNVALPGFEEDEELSTEAISTATPYRNSDLERQAGMERLEEKRVYATGTLDSVLTGDKKIVAFVGTSKNGTSFIVNNLAVLFSSLGVKTAILDMTKNKNSYYIYTNNDENLRQIASNSIDKLEEGLAEGIKADRNLDVFTAIPNEEKDFSNAEAILTTLARNESLVLIDCDFDTPLGYFANASEIYLVQSMDILTIQPLTAFLRELKTNGILDQEKLRVVVNKEIKVRGLTSKVIIGGMSFYNDPSMSYMTELFNKDKIKACTLPFEDSTYSKYLETLVNCNISLSGYSKNFMNSLKILGNMVYPLQSKQTYAKGPDYTKNNNFSEDMNNTLNQMRSKY